MENAADAVFDHEREEKMHLLKQEWKKLVTRDGFLAVFLLCFAATLLILWYRVYRISYGDSFLPSQYCRMAERVQNMTETEAEKYFSEEQQEYDPVRNVVQKEWRSAHNYENYLDKIRSGGSGGLRGLGKNVYQERLQKKLQAKYREMDPAEVSFAGGRGVSLFCHTDVADMMAVLMMLLIILRLVVWEAESGMDGINMAARNGAAWLTHIKWAVGLMASAAVLLLVQMYKLWLYTSAYGFTGWNRVIQILPEFVGVDRRITVFWFVCVFLVCKTAGFLLLYTIFFWLACVGRSAVRTIILYGLFTGVSLFTAYGISLSGYLAVLRYFSPAQCINQEMLLSGYHALKLFQYPVSYLGLWTAVSCVLFFVLAGLIFRSRIRRVESSLSRKLVFHRGSRRYRPKYFQSLSGWEGRKGMLYEGGLFVLVLTLAVVLLVYRPPKESISTSQESYYREVMLGLQGRDTPEKRDQIREKIRKLETLEKDVEQNGQKYTQTAMQVAMSELEKLDVLREVDTYLDYLDGRKDPYIVYEKGYLLLLGKKLPGGYLKLCSIMAVIVMVLISARLWGEDEWCGTGMLCMASRTGMKRITHRKLCWNFLYALFAGIIVYAPWIWRCGQTYSLQAWSVAADNLTVFKDIGFMSLGNVVLCSYALRVLYLAAVGCVTKMVQRKISSQSLTVYTALIFSLLPVLLFA